MIIIVNPLGCIFKVSILVGHHYSESLGDQARLGCSTGWVLFLTLGACTARVTSQRGLHLTVPATVDCGCLPIVSAVEEVLSSYYVSLTCLCVAVFAIVHWRRKRGGGGGGGGFSPPKVLEGGAEPPYLGPCLLLLYFKK